MDVEDALELLSPNFQHPAVRRYAITRLKQAQDDDLLLYLLQLVQALKYENFDDIIESYRRLMNEKDILKSIDDGNSTIDGHSMTDSMGKLRNKGDVHKKSERKLQSFTESNPRVIFIWVVFVCLHQKSM